MSERMYGRSNDHEHSIKRKAIAVGISALAFLGGASARALHMGENEKYTDRHVAEVDIKNSISALEDIISGRHISESGQEKHRLSIDNSKVVDEESVRESGEVENEYVVNFMYIPGGVEYTGHMQDLGNIANTEQLAELNRISIDWSKVDIHASGPESKDLPTQRFDGLRVITDQHGNNMIVGVPSASNPNRSLIILDVLSGGAEDGGVMIIGAESEDPVTVNLAELREGHNTRVMPYLDRDHWGVSGEETVDSLQQVADVLSDRGVSIKGMFDVNRGEKSAEKDTEGLPVVHRYAVVASANGVAVEL